MIEVFKEQLKKFNVPMDVVREAHESSYDRMEWTYHKHVDKQVEARLLASLHAYVHIFERDELQAFLDEDLPLTMTLGGREVKEGDLLFCSEANRILLVDGLKEEGGVVGVTSNGEFFPLCNLERYPSDLVERLVDLVHDLQATMDEVTNIYIARDHTHVLNAGLNMISGIKDARIYIENFLHLFKDEEDDPRP